MPIDVKFYTEFEKVENNIACKVINYNKNRELLKNIPNIKYLDLAIVFYYFIEDKKMGEGSILIYDSHLCLWGKTKEEIYHHARKNTTRLLPYQFQKIEEILKGSLDEEELLEDGMLPMYVLSNERKYLGAVAILYDSILASIGECLEDDFYILPSSIHEVIMIPKKIEITSDELKVMVEDINLTQVLPEEVLSNEVYVYEREKHYLKIVS